MISPKLVLKLAIPTPLRTVFDYLPPVNFNEQDLAALSPGARFKVSFNRQTVMGVYTGIGEPSIPIDKIKAADKLIDSDQAIPHDCLDLSLWAADYYQTPVGEAIHTAIPKALRIPEEPPQKLTKRWRLTTEGMGLHRDSLKRSKKQQKLLHLLLDTASLPEESLKTHEIGKPVAAALEKKGLIEAFYEDSKKAVAETNEQSTSASLFAEAPLELNEEQKAALYAIRFHEYACYLLEGTTGSGKTEVFMQAIAHALQLGKQALILVPEIGLTPQTVDRLRQRFNVPVVELHSGISDKTRFDNWQAAARNQAQIVIGTRLSVFTPFKDLGIIIIDEEHDLSFKQQDGMRYSARDLAIVRASKLGIPLILGSATPALETINNAISGKFHHLKLTRRTGTAQPPAIQLVDMRNQELVNGFAQCSIDAIEATLKRNEQVLIFINRRGYAPAIICQSCGWSVQCKRCDAQMSLHRSPYHLRCHHCDARRAPPKICPQCQSPNLIPQGHGTERTEEFLKAHFSNFEVLRVDRDSMSKKSAMKELVTKVKSGEPCILVGTQMLAKGHHFPKVTLVIIVDADSGLVSGDFRGTERAAQLITQVAGRAGRADEPGTVLLQSYKPSHPFFEKLLNDGYHSLARDLLNTRKLCQLPPYWSMAIFHAESKRAENATAFIQQLKQIATTMIAPQTTCEFLGPIPALLERKEDRLRFQLQIKFQHRAQLQALLKKLVPEIERQAIAKRCRWALDVDPLEVG